MPLHSLAAGDEIEEDDGFLSEFIDDATPASASEPPSTIVR